MLRDSSFQIIGNSNVQRGVIETGHNVGVVGFEHDNIDEYSGNNRFFANAQNDKADTQDNKVTNCDLEGFNSNLVLVL